MRNASQNIRSTPNGPHPPHVAFNVSVPRIQVIPTPEARSFAEASALSATDAGNAKTCGIMFDSVIMPSRPRAFEVLEFDLPFQNVAYVE